MSLTGPDHLYAALMQSGANHFAQAVCLQRPRYVNYSSLSPTSAASTNIAKLSGFDWTLHFGTPFVDFDPAYLPAGSTLTAGAGHLVLSAPITVTILGQSMNGSLWAVAVPVVNASAHTVTVQVTQVEVAGVTLPPLVLNVIKAVLNNALSALKIPYPAFSAGAFTAVIASGPSIGMDELTFTGNL